MHTILHIGAGQASELPQWLETGAKQIVLVEPNPELAEQLRQKTAQHPQIAVVEAAITTEPTNNQLQEYNLPEASSLRQTTGLKALFPGLKTLSTHGVATLTPAQLLEQFPLAPNQPATLVLQAAGEEHDILQALIKTDQLKCFSELNLHANPEPYYKGSVEAEKTLKALTEYGYDIANENQKDPDWPSWKLTRNPLKRQVSDLQVENQELKANNEKLEKTLSQNKQQQEKASKQFELQEAEAGKKVAELEQSLKETTHKLNHANEEADAKVQAEQNLRKQLEVICAELSEKDLQLAELAKQNKEAEKQKAEQARQRGELEKQNEKLLIQFQELEEKHQKTQQQLQKIQKQHEQTLQTSSAQSEELRVSRQKVDEAQKAFAEEQIAHKATSESLEEHKQWFRSRKQQAEQLQTELAETQQQHDGLKAEIETLKYEKQQLLDNQSQGQSAITQLEQKMEQLFSQQAGQLQQTANVLGQHVTRSFQGQRQHIQNVASLGQYFESGAQPLEFGQWAIGADLATHLVRAIEQNNYDLILEFGSGTSTVLMARALLNQQGAAPTSPEQNALTYDATEPKNSPLPSRERGRGRGGAGHSKHTTEYDLPKRILSFEQTKAFQQKTATALSHEGLTNLVDLVLAPLVPMPANSHQSNAPLFYDCATQLARVAQLFEGRQARLLVLVDGPHSPDGNPQAREPALGCLLQHLSAHQLDILLDDSNRQGEQQVLEAWKSTCEQRGLSYQHEQLNTEKGATWLTVAP